MKGKSTLKHQLPYDSLMKITVNNIFYPTQRNQHGITMLTTTTVIQYDGSYLFPHNKSI